MKRKPVEVEVVDHSLRDKVSEHRFVNDGVGVLTDETRETEIPEEYMERLEKHLGDAMAQVTVGADVATSVDYGNKAGAFVSVKVTCNNHEDDINAALDIARELAEKKVAENHARMNDLLNKARGIAAEPPSKGPSVARSTTPPGERKINVSSGKTPSFRR